jgi:hypothetical protein
MLFVSPSQQFRDGQTNGILGFWVGMLFVSPSQQFRDGLTNGIPGF